MTMTRVMEGLIFTIVMHYHVGMQVKSAAIKYFVPDGDIEK